MNPVTRQARSQLTLRISDLTLESARRVVLGTAGLSLNRLCEEGIAMAIEAYLQRAGKTIDEMPTLEGNLPPGRGISGSYYGLTAAQAKAVLNEPVSNGEPAVNGATSNGASGKGASMNGTTASGAAYSSLGVALDDSPALSAIFAVLLRECSEGRLRELLKEIEAKVGVTQHVVSRI